MAVLACASVNKNADKIKDVLSARLGWIGKMVDLVTTNIDALWECEMIIDLVPAHGYQVELETFQMEDQVVRHFLQTCPVVVSLRRVVICSSLTSSLRRRICRRTIRICTCCRLP